MTTLLPIFVHSVLISGPIDSKGNERIKLRSAPLSTANMATFFVQTAASSLSEQLRQ
jgi:hypothetical protein